MTSLLVPMVIEKTSSGERSYDLFSRLMKDRVIMLNGIVDQNSASIITAQLLFLESEQPGSDITLYINSGGGEVTAGLAIYDTMQFIKCDVVTVVIGQAASMGSFLAMAGTKGKRFVLPSSRTMIHRVSSGTEGTSGSVHVQQLELEDIKRSVEEANRLNVFLTEMYAKHNSKKKKFKELYEIMKFDTFLSAQDAVDFGLADKVIADRSSF